ncbi:hypothetical protein FOCC_FOCC001516, partial [Frankliniella occidentalis]
MRQCRIAWLIRLLRQATSEASRARAPPSWPRERTARDHSTPTPTVLSCAHSAAQPNPTLQASTHGHTTQRHLTALRETQARLSRCASCPTMCDCCDPHDGDRDLFVPDVLLEVLALTAARRPRERRDQVAAAAAVPGGLRGGVLYPTPRRLSRPDWGGLPCSGYPGLVRVPVCGDVSCRHLPCYTWHLGAHRPDTLYSRLMQRRGSAAPDQGDDGILRDLLQKPIILECGAEADDAHDGLVQPVQATVTTPGGTVTLYRWPSPDPTASQVAVGPAAAPAASLVDKAARRKADRKRSM